MEVGGREMRGPMGDHTGRRRICLHPGREEDVYLVAVEAAEAGSFECGQPAEQCQPARAEDGDPSVLVPIERAGVSDVNAAMWRLPASGRDTPAEHPRRQVPDSLAPAHDAVLFGQQPFERGLVIAHGRHPAEFRRWALRACGQGRTVDKARALDSRLVDNADSRRVVRPGG
jgi:hypothetical protein